jgi:hypothetical protein
MNFGSAWSLVCACWALLYKWHAMRLTRLLAVPQQWQDMLQVPSKALIHVILCDTSGALFERQISYSSTFDALLFCC